jgi:preprotein translocase subunit YajC
MPSSALPLRDRTSEPGRRGGVFGRPAKGEKKTAMPTALNLIASVLLAQGDKAPPAGPSSMLISLSPFVLIAVLFYLLMIRPERRKRAELTAMLNNLKKNDRVVTIGGIYGTVVNVQKDLDEVTIKVDENTNTKLRMQRGAISRVLAPDTAAPMKTD